MPDTNARRRLSDEVQFDVWGDMPVQTYLQAKRILEDSFLPYHCRCHLERYSEMMLSFYEPGIREPFLIVPHVSRSEWDSLPGVASLVHRLSQDIDLVMALQKPGEDG
ncbi:DUF1652 domain-containing protein [Pseudomonas sp. LA21]|uniref:DUF1652 domain-containing protein n=1 Tax=Pseudomonas sp. LA21 TaxID=2893373 RepID=UPI001FB7C691|nr:DUF1652 domain-containing protein [Pseudomonas sp. LA21]MCJ1886968.1 DUF1652 domain-containing protein [Pseudomonas sp. LA21]